MFYNLMNVPLTITPKSTTKLAILPSTLNVWIGRHYSIALKTHVFSKDLAQKLSNCISIIRYPVSQCTPKSENRAKTWFQKSWLGAPKSRFWSDLRTRFSIVIHEIVISAEIVILGAKITISRVCEQALNIKWWCSIIIYWDMYGDIETST